MGEITIDINEYHRLKEAEVVLLGILMESKDFDHIVVNDGYVKFLDNRDIQLRDAVRENESYREILRRIKEGKTNNPKKC